MYNHSELMSSVGLIGLGVIGGNLAYNLQRTRDVHVYERSPEKVKSIANSSKYTVEKVGSE